MAKIDHKYIISIVSFLIILIGFYYTTNYRLDNLETKIKELETNNELIIRLDEKLINVQNKTDEIYDHIIKHDNN